MFIPGETEIQTYVINFNADELNKAVITYEQYGEVILEKVITDFQNDETEANTCCFTVHLSQEESLLFKDHESVELQLNVYFTDGTRRTSETLVYQTGKQQYREVIS